MTRTSIGTIVLLAALGLSATLAFADDPAGTPPSDPTSQAETTLQTTANGQAETHAGDVLAGIRERAAKANDKAAAKWDTDVAAAMKATNEAGAKDGHAVAERLGTEFGVTADALDAEKTELNASWGELMIAHTLMANATADVTAKDLFDLRGQGMGWGKIAIGMGLQLGGAISAVKAESRVANGLDKADGKVATIHGVGATAGAGVPKAAIRANSHATPKMDAKGAASAGVGAGVAADHAKVGVGAGAGKGGK